MEWDQIANRWAEMTHRIRCEAPRRPQDAEVAEAAAPTVTKDRADRMAAVAFCPAPSLPPASQQSGRAVG